MGFTGAERGGVLDLAAVQPNGAAFRTTRPGVYTCGDARRGQSLIVWAIREGRDCAAEVHEWLQASKTA